MKKNQIVISIPHSATTIPQDIRKLIPHGDDILFREPDLYSDQIFGGDDTRTVLAEYSRIIDVNRAPDEIYLDGPLRSIGVVMLNLSNGEKTFKNDPSIETMTEWIEKYHKPFHHRLLTELMKEGTRFLIDCHTLSSKGDVGHLDTGKERADIVLGNEFFSTCSSETTQFFRSFFETRGYSVSINDPYPGRYILGAYCSRLRTPGIQLEVNRKLYMNEVTFEPYEKKIKHFKKIFFELIDTFCTWDDERSSERPITNLSS